MTTHARLLGRDVPWADVKGFNYQPSYGRTGFELWRRFDAETIDRELARGRELFPGMNALRWWLDWDAFVHEPEAFARNFETSLQIAERHGLAVMPVLFNRWHSPAADYGGIYVDHFVPGVSWVQSEGMFDAYLERIVGGHAGDERIFTWDLCNEPFTYTAPVAEVPAIVVDAELAWLTAMASACKRLDPAMPLGVSIHPLHGPEGLRQVEPLSDVLLIHPYTDNEDGLLDAYVEIGAAAGKPLLAAEICWGDFDDAKRVQIIRDSFSALAERGIGWLAYLLNHSLIPDAHRPEFGPLDYYGPLHFIEADGSLRPGHDVFNEF